MTNEENFNKWLEMKKRELDRMPNELWTGKNFKIEPKECNYCRGRGYKKCTPFGTTWGDMEQYRCSMCNGQGILDNNHD